MSERIGAIILAAGESRRMGRLKQLLPWGSRTVLGEVIHTALASGAHEVVAVLGHGAAEIREEQFAADHRLRFVLNARYAEGMLSSVQTGVEALSKECAAFLLFLGDQPLVQAAVAHKLIDAYEPGAILVPVSEGRRGHPPLICLSYREEILRLTPAAGLRGLYQNHPDMVRHLPVATPSIHIDLDTPEEYERYRPKEA